MNTITRNLGKVTNIVIHLMSFESALERNISQYNSKWQEKQLKSEIEKSDPLAFFIDSGGDSPRCSRESRNVAINSAGP